MTTTAEEMLQDKNKKMVNSHVESFINKRHTIMYRIFFIGLTAAFFLLGCGQAPRETRDEKQLTQEERGFMDNLASLCGQSFRGEETYMADGRDSWAHLDFVMHVTVCEEEEVHIPFHLSDDTSRTWMFLVEDGRLRFRHDHRYPDGTPEAQTLYGGYADGKGTAHEQYFPKDDYSRELLEGEYGREWQIVMDEEMTTFSYRLLYDGDIVFQADFDLTEPI